MRLSDTEIQKALREARLVIDPCPEEHSIRGVSIDLTLGNQVRVFQNHGHPALDLGADGHELQKAVDAMMSDALTITEDQPFYLHPGELILAVTHEYLELPEDLVGWLDGRSSLARLGLTVHVTAHRIDPGWKGQIVLECHNVGKVALKLRPKMRIGAISFETILGKVRFPYSSRSDAKYCGQQGPQASAVARDSFSLQASIEGGVPSLNKQALF